MKIETELPRETEQGQKAVLQVMKRLSTALKQMQAAQMKLVTVLRPTHDRRLVSDAATFSDACEEELRAVRDELEALDRRAR